MKIIHCADLHLDSKINGLPLDKSKYRKEETIIAFEKLCEYADNNGVSVVIVAGDSFDTPKISKKIKERFIHAIEKCKNTDFLFLSGNHDEDGFNDGSVNLKNLKFFSDKWQYYTYDNVVICGANILENSLDALYDTLSLEKDKINVVTLHGIIAGYNAKKDAEIISIPRLKNKNIDYLALGHIHSYEEGKIDERGKYAYSGCLEGRGFDETGEKGFVLLNIIEGKISTEFIKTSIRTMEEFSFDISNYSDFLTAKDQLIKELCEEYRQTSLVKVNLIGERNANFDLDTESLERTLNGSFFYAEVVDKTVIKINIEDYKDNKTIKGEFIREVLNSDLTEEEKDAVLTYSLKLFREGESKV